ncbi:hypothetical protein AUR04nite_16720 [Glutamicibacter uratoxydans]|uniref:hydroxyisourate hydrolase n=1 Tax=Glutamicibacter uratoxydans TaxID=43667 RepID=A0A4Y4DRI1_GLUUR|nr:hydroxyisourate hydrolase [Glutamicibacter uratoxydans]GED06140.1 hypothetical protein AUR04nite_16720 [Glutamicibacter uratoxydans]
MAFRRTKISAALLALPMAFALSACSPAAPTATPSPSALPEDVQVQPVSAKSERGHLSTHILDTVSGKPAQGVDVVLEHRVKNKWKQVANGTTDEDGRIESLGPKTLENGAYRITFETEAYFKQLKQDTFFPSIPIDFYISSPDQHYHVPLLLSPFAYSTYRGS